ncbi:MAG: hypothetical protein JSS20_20415 [Proteobacteria bacterium]|nr:hypothetical protein [Pseudomonadota bacterium]
MTSNGKARAGAVKLGDIVDLLALLVKRGASAVAVPNGEASVHVASAGGVSSIPVARAVLQAGIDRRWIEVSGGTVGERFRISTEGRTALRRTRSRLVARRASSQGVVSASSKPAINPAESPLSWLKSRRDAAGREMLSEAQAMAGERLRSDMTLAGLTPRTTMSWSGTPASGGLGAGHGRDLADNAIAARTRVTAALKAIGPEHADILIDVCAHLRGLEEIARTERWPNRSVRLVLQRALSALARHYGYEREVSIEERLARRMRHWGSDGYRPTLEAWKKADNQAD